MRKEKIIERIKNGEMSYNHVSIFKKKDLDIIAAFVSVASSYELDQFARKNKNNKEVMTLIVDQNPRMYKHIGKQLKRDYNLAKLAVSKLGANYAILDEFLKDFPEIIELTLKENNDCITLISEDLFADRTVAMTLLKVNPTYFSKIADELKENEDFMIEVAISHPELISEFDPKWYDNEKIFASACAVDGTVLKFASTRIRDNMDIVRIAVDENPRAVEFASLRIRSNIDFMKEMIEKDAMNLEFASANIQDNEEVVVMAIKLNPEAIKFASKRLLHDDRFLKNCIYQNPKVEKCIKETRATEARSYKLKSIKSDDVHVRNGVVFGVKLDEDKNNLYNDMMKKSFTVFLDDLSHEELLVLDRLLKAEANIIVEKIKKEGKKELSERDIRTIATYRKVYLRVKQLKLKEEDYDRSKVDMTKCYKLVDDAYKIANKVVRV